MPFTSDTPGNAPATAAANAGGVSVNPTFIAPGAPNNGTSVSVQNTYTDSLTNNVFGNGNVVVLNDGSVSVSSAALFQGAVADEISTGVFTVSLDWMQDSGPASSSGFIGLTNQNRGKNLSALFLDLGEDVGNIRSGNDVNFGATLGTAARGVPHHLDWVVDLSQANFAVATKVYLDGTLLATQQREPFGIHDGASAFGSMAISTAAPAIGTLAFDNIQIQAGTHIAVPAPPLPPVYPAQRKMIEFGYDAPDTAFMRDNIESMKREPFNGVVFTARPNTGTNQEFTWGGWGSTVFTRASMQHAVDELQATNFVLTRTISCATT